MKALIAGILTALLSLPVWAGVTEYRPGRGDTLPFPGVVDGVGNDATIEAWKELKTFTPQKPLQKVYVSPAAGGDIDVAGNDANPGTIDLPLNGFAGINEMVSNHGCGFDFILDSGDSWVLADGLENGLFIDLDCPADWEHDIGIRIRASNPDNLIDALTTGHIAWKGVSLDCDGVDTGTGHLGATSSSGTSNSTEAWLALENIALHGTCQWDSIIAEAGGKVAALNVLVHVDPGATNNNSHAFIAQDHATNGGGSHLLAINSYVSHEPDDDTQGTPMTKLGKTYFVIVGGQLFYHDQIDVACGGGACDGQAVYFDTCGGATVIDHEIRGGLEAAVTGNFHSSGYRMATGNDVGGHCAADFNPSDVGMRVDLVRTLVHDMPTWDLASGCKGAAYYFNAPQDDDTLNGYEAYGWQIRSVGGSDHVSFCQTATGPLISPQIVHINGYAFESDNEGQTKNDRGQVFHASTPLGVCAGGGAQDGTVCEVGDAGGACQLAGGTCSFRTNLTFTAQNGVYDDEDTSLAGWYIQANGHVKWANVCASTDLPPHWTPFFGDADSPATCTSFNDGTSRDTNGASNGIFHDGNHDFATGSDTVTSMKCASGNVCKNLVDAGTPTIPIAFPAGMPPFVSNGATVTKFTIDMTTQDAGG